MYALVARLLKHNIFKDMESIKEATLKEFFDGLTVCDWMDYVDNVRNNEYNS